MIHDTRHTPSETGLEAFLRFFSGKTGLSLVQLAVGIAVYYLIPEQKELALGIIGTAVAGGMIGAGHKFKKGME